MREIMERKNVIYTILNKNDNLTPFPYPPLYQENDMDYICFTNQNKINSKFWKIKYIQDMENTNLESYLTQYNKKFFLASNQILVGNLLNKNNIDENSIITVPKINEIPEITFDKKNFIPTKDENGQYLYKENPLYTDGPYHGRKLLLTIGVPVSNQIDTIERCLFHIKPLLQELASELLVINTGSNDGTLDICKAYGARIIDFPWCNNMSFVRNTGIFHAYGDWYLSIDDDEWFENVEDILSFFQSGTYLNYQAATYMQRNYHTSSGETYSDSPALRMAQITPNLHFEGRIHDQLILPEELTPYQLTSYVHHYGFIRDKLEKNHEKYIRNTSNLLYDIYEYPESLRYNYQLAKEFNSYRLYKEACAFLFRGLSIEKETPNAFYKKNHAVHLLATLYNAKDKKLFHMGKFIEKNYPLSLAERAFIHHIQADLGLQLHLSPNEILGHIRAYEMFQLQFEKNPNDSILYSDIGIETCTNPQFQMDANVIAFCAHCQANHTLQALKILKKIVPEKILWQKDNFRFYCLNGPIEVQEEAAKRYPKNQKEESNK